MLRICAVLTQSYPYVVDVDCYKVYQSTVVENRLAIHETEVTTFCQGR